MRPDTGHLQRLMQCIVREHDTMCMRIECSAQGREIWHRGVVLCCTAKFSVGQSGLLIYSIARTLALVLSSDVYIYMSSVRLETDFGCMKMIFLCVIELL